jgi:predicted O-methyltransferase YrrM
MMTLRDAASATAVGRSPGRSLLGGMRAMNTDATATEIDRVANMTSSMLDNDVLRAIYEASFSVSRGVYVEIGPAQGASTLAIALGRRSAGRTAMIYTADVFTESSSLKTDDVGINIAILRSNLAECGVGDHVRIILASSEDVAATVPIDAEIGLFLVDADGALDRDFKQFYDRILPGGHIILDVGLNVAAQEYVNYTDRRLRDYVISKHAQDIAELSPFGRPYTVARFAQTLIELGLIEEVKTVSFTTFFRKVGDKPYAQSGAPAALCA